MRRLLLTLLACVSALTLVPSAHAELPAGWPSNQLLIGMRDDENGADALRQATRLQIRYHYLSGGVNTGRGWSTFTQGDGSFVPAFIDDSADHGFLPVFSYYQMRESAPGNGMEEVAGFFANLSSRATMTSYLQDVRLFFQRAGQTGKVAVLQVEPDMWGYIERRGGAATPVQVSTTGLSELAGLPNTAAGLAKAFVRLRDKYAPKVLLGYHLSVWGTGEDIAFSDPSDDRIDHLAAVASAYYRSLGADFDLVFAEQADRDAGYRRVRDGAGPDAFWTPDDYVRQARFLRGVSSALRRSIVLWQLPLGNMSQPNTPNHYKDNRVQTFLGPGGAAVRKMYVDAGVIALLFGKAQAEATCACDDDHDGKDDDGGLFKRLANQVIAAGTELIPGAGARKPATGTSSSGAGGGSGSGAAPVVAVKTSILTPRVRRGGTARISVRLTSRSAARIVVAIQLYRPSAGSTPTHQTAYRGVTLRKGVPRTFRATYRVPAGEQTGRWQVKVGLFDPDFKKLLVWRPAAGRFVVG